MTLTTLKPAGLILLLTIILFGSCGNLNLDSMLPGDYEVSALVNEADIGSHSFAGRDDRIAPYFINPETKDPDLTGLAVFFEDPGGAELGRVYYSISGIEGEDEERTIQVSRLDKPFPAFSIPPELEPGRCTLVFQVMRENDVLSRIERPLYYLGTADLELEDARIVLPDEGTLFIPPGIMVMLEAEVSVKAGDPVTRLEPYVVWYSGRAIIGEGLVRGGVHRFMWQAPEQTGFKTIRVELLPFNPAGTYLSAGKYKELSLPVSSKSERTPAFIKDEETLTHWYRFRGNLLDQKTGQPLVSQNGGEPQWHSRGNVYGLVLGTRDAYSLPLFTGETDRGYGRITCRFVPLGEGSLLSITFTAERFVQPLNLDLSISGGGLVLSLGTEAGESAGGPEAVPIDIAANGGFITASVNFRYEPDSFAADLALDGPIHGGTLTLGGEKEPETAAAPGESAGAAELPGALALLDELLAAYSAE
ncbi:MAG: hypothetical protein LBJ24_06210 [Treponema sp.]|jgi:hypothetical protein|nr:hypothetical protein [Treponema sp.]